MIWEKLTKEEELLKLQQPEDGINKICILKHSPRCGVSNMVFNRMKNINPESAKDSIFYLVDVLTNREISNSIAQIFNIVHESPQLIILVKGKVHAVFNHTSISPACLE